MAVHKLKLVSVQDVQEKENGLIEKIKSDDAHIIALALVTDVKVLVSNDNKLIRDFKEHISQGKVYKTKSHRHLLTEDTCP
jgi:predicted nucleic acid-binding protein